MKIKPLMGRRIRIGGRLHVNQPKKLSRVKEHDDNQSEIGHTENPEVENNVTEHKRDRKASSAASRSRAIYLAQEKKLLMNLLIISTGFLVFYIPSTILAFCMRFCNRGTQCGCETRH